MGLLLLCKGSYELQWIVIDAFSCFHSFPILVHTLLWQCLSSLEWLLTFSLFPCSHIHPKFPVIFRFSTFGGFFTEKYILSWFIGLCFYWFYGTFYRSYGKWEPARDGWNMPGVLHSSTKHLWHLWAAPIWGSTAQQQTGPSSSPTFPLQRFPCSTEMCEQVQVFMMV